jgi:hypothetical protein
MKTKILWAIVLVFMVQSTVAQKVVKTDVALASYAQFESTLLEALKKYREDYLKNGVSAPIAEKELVGVAQEAIFNAFISDKEKVVDAILSQPVTVTVSINLTYDRSKDFPKIQKEYVDQMTAFWNAFTSRGIKESIGYTPRAGETTSNVSKTTITTKEEVNGQIKSIKTTTTETSTSNAKSQTVQTEVTPVTFKTPEDLKPYINPLVESVTHYVETWVKTWEIRN